MKFDGTNQRQKGIPYHQTVGGWKLKARLELVAKRFLV